MRNLTIKRMKRFVGAAGVMKVYAEDAVNGQITINGLSCRMLGKLKNGEEKTFEIGNEATKIFVIADQLSRNFCNDFYPVPAGEEDVCLSGRNCFHPGAGNPFRFDGVTDEEVLANRKKGRNKGFLILILALIIGFSVGWTVPKLLRSRAAAPQEFSVQGMSITLTDAFSEASYQGYTQCFDSREAAVFVLKEAFTLAEGLEDLTLQEYGELVLLNNNQFENTDLQETDGITWFEYRFINPETNVTYYYYTTLFKSTDAFWMIQFTTMDDLADEKLPQFQQWAKTISFE